MREHHHKVVKKKVCFYYIQRSRYNNTKNVVFKYLHFQFSLSHTANCRAYRTMSVMIH